MDELKFQCSGFDFRKPDFGDEGRQIFFSKVDGIRSHFDHFFKKYEDSLSKHYPNQFCKFGRFSCDDDVLGRIQSATTEIVFMKDTTQWILAGLLDAGDAEYHYCYEKDYGREE